MEFDYKELGNALAWNRMRKNLRQTDLELLSDGKLKQPAISALERGETRMAVDTLVAYCNAINIRPDIILETFLTTEREDETSGAIVDPYVIQMAELMKKCMPSKKIALLQIAAIVLDIHEEEWE